MLTGIPINQGFFYIFMINIKLKDIKIAIQGKGRLRESSLNYLAQIGFVIEDQISNLVSGCKKTEADIVYLRDDDIPKYVASGVTDFGIVGENVYYENPSGARMLRKLGFGKCTLVIAVPQTLNLQSVAELQGKKIATTYPNLLRSYLNKSGVKAEIIEVKGSAEVAPYLGFADAICDLVQSGNTLRENGLKPFATIMNSEAILIESPCLKKFELNPFENENP